MNNLFQKLREFYKKLGITKASLFILMVIVTVVGSVDFIVDLIAYFYSSDRTFIPKIDFPYNFIVVAISLVVESIISLNSDFNDFKEKSISDFNDFKEKSIDAQGKFTQSFSNIPFIKVLHLSSPEVSKRLIANYEYLEKIETLKTKESRQGLEKTPFTKLTNEALLENRRILRSLSQGAIDVPLSLAVRKQKEIMEQYNDRMDAVSFDDLRIWKKLEAKDSEISSLDSDTRLGKEYYDCILERAGGVPPTIVTRIFVLNQQTVRDDPRLIAEIIYRHETDNIGTALVFEENFSEEMVNSYKKANDEEIYNLVEPRKDFALLDVDKVATFFRHNKGNRFEALFNIDKNHKLFSLQKMLHQTYTIAAVFGTQTFVKNLTVEKAFYDAATWEEMKEIIVWVRDEMRKNNVVLRTLLESINSNGTPNETEPKAPEIEGAVASAGLEDGDETQKSFQAAEMFSVYLGKDEISNQPPEKEKSIDLIEKKIKTALEISTSLRWKVKRYDEVLKEYRKAKEIKI